MFIRVEASIKEMETICNLDTDNEDNEITSFYIQHLNENKLRTFPLSLTICGKKARDKARGGKKIKITIDYYSCNSSDWIHYNKNLDYKKIKNSGAFPKCITSEMILLGLTSMKEWRECVDKVQIYSYKVDVNEIDIVNCASDITNKRKDERKEENIIQGDCWWNIYNPQEYTHFPILGFQLFSDIYFTKELIKLYPQQSLPSEQQLSPRGRYDEKVWTSYGHLNISEDESDEKMKINSNISSEKVYKEVVANLISVSNLKRVDKIDKIISSFREYAIRTYNNSNTTVTAAMVVIIKSNVFGDMYVYASCTVYNTPSRSCSYRQEYDIFCAPGLAELWKLIPDEIKCQFLMRDDMRRLNGHKVQFSHLSSNINGGKRMNDTYYYLLKKYYLPQVRLALEQTQKESKLPKELQNLILSCF
jgi:hypothetical protein